MENNIWQSAAIIILTEFYVLWNARLKHQQSVALVNWLTGKKTYLTINFYVCFIIFVFPWLKKNPAYIPCFANKTARVHLAEFEMRDLSPQHFNILLSIQNSRTMFSVKILC